MRKGYWIVSVDVLDQDAFGEYAARTPVALAKFGGRFLCRAGAYEVGEGKARSRNSIIEFPTYQDALSCWNSSEYQEARSYRIGAAEIDIVIVEGCE